MAIILKASYSKKLMMGMDSHSYLLVMETEITDPSQVSVESQRMYGILQEAVDRELQQVGFVPSPGYGMQPAQNGAHSNGNGAHRPVSGNNGAQTTAAGRTSNARATRTSGVNNRRSNVSNARATDKQRDFIDKIIQDYSLTNGEVETTANTMFGISDVSKLNKLEASGLIDELLSLYGEKQPESAQRGNGRNHQPGGAR